MPAAHARLSPSSSERWIECPASVQLVEGMPRQDQAPESSYAIEGTAAHALGELKASHHFGKITQRQLTSALKKWRLQYAITPEVEEEMTEHIDAYVQLLQDHSEMYPNTQVMLEERVDTGVPSSWGTSDAVLVSPRHVEIVDLKYGQGVPVDAAGNSQLRLYGLGALDSFGDVLGETEIVRMTVFQPRLNSTSTEELTAEELRAWRSDTAIPRAKLALSDHAPFGPSERACRWCPASGRCVAQMEKFTSIDFATPPGILTPEEMAGVLAQVPEIKNWINALEEAALTRAYSEDVEIPGWKVVLSGSRRVIEDFDGVQETLRAAGYSDEQFTQVKLRGIGELEKLLGKDDFNIWLGDYVRKTDGKPSLVLDTDKRAAASPDNEAKKEFSDG